MSRTPCGTRAARICQNQWALVASSQEYQRCSSAPSARFLEAVRLRNKLEATEPKVTKAGVRPGKDLPSRRMSAKREAHELLLIEEADAWFEYLEATRGQSLIRYREIEPWAWARLTQRLRAIRARRAKLRPAAA